MNRYVQRATSARSWHPIMPRGEPRGHGIFCHIERRIRKGRSRLAGVALVLLSLIGCPRCDAADAGRRRRRRRHRHLCSSMTVVAPATGTFRCYDARPSPFERHIVSQAPRDAAHCRSCTLLPLVIIALFVALSFPPPFLPHLLAQRQRYNQCIDVSNLSARDAATTAVDAATAAAAVAAIAAANCIDAQGCAVSRCCSKQQLA